MTHLIEHESKFLLGASLREMHNNRILNYYHILIMQNNNAQSINDYKIVYINGVYYENSYFALLLFLSHISTT